MFGCTTYYLVSRVDSQGLCKRAFDQFCTWRVKVPGVQPWSVCRWGSLCSISQVIGSWMKPDLSLSDFLLSFLKSTRVDFLGIVKRCVLKPACPHICSDHEEWCVGVTCPRTRPGYGPGPGKNFFVPPSFSVRKCFIPCPMVRAVVFLIRDVLEVVAFSKSFHKSYSEITFFIKYIYNLYVLLACLHFCYLG